MPSLQQKLMISLGSAALFVLVSHPAVYKFTNGLIGGLTSNGCPTLLGLASHAVVFYLLTLLSMKGTYQSEATKRKHSLIAAALFALLNSPMTYKLVRSVLGAGIASATGCPTMTGLLTHAGVYTAILVLLMGK
jgi:hypothetical protein